MWHLTLSDLVYRTRRFVVVVVGSSLVFTLLFLMTGLVEQFNKEPFLTAEAIGGQAWVLPAGVSGPFTSSATLTPEQVEATEAAGDFDPIVIARGTLHIADRQQEVLVVGHTLGGIGTPDPYSGSAASRATELVVDESSEASLGESVRLGDETFSVVGLSTDTTLLAGLPVVFLPIDSARTALFGGAPVVSALVTDATPTDLPTDVTVLTVEEVGADALGPLENAISSIDLIRGLLWFVAAVIIGGVLYLTAIERERDFAVIKAIGGARGQLAVSLMAQATSISLVAVALAVAIQALVVPVFPLTVRVPVRAYWQLPALAFAVALIASQAGLRRVRRSDPITAFSGP